MAVRKHAHRITLLVELSSIGNSHLPCFDGRPRQVVDELRDRLMPSINDAGKCRPHFIWIICATYYYSPMYLTTALLLILLLNCFSISVTAAREAFESCVMAAVGHWRCAMCLNPQPKSPPWHICLLPSAHTLQPTPKSNSTPIIMHHYPFFFF